MKREEFLKPYLLLVNQPWGRRYLLNTPEGQAEAELYFRHLSMAHPVIWARVCEHYASGDKWPSLDELRTTIVHNTPPPRLPPLSGPPVPADYLPRRLVMAWVRGQNSLRQSILEEVPRFLADTPRADPDYARAEVLLAMATKLSLFR
jgi:hypothetical protein